MPPFYEHVARLNLHIREKNHVLLPQDIATRHKIVNEDRIYVIISRKDRVDRVAFSARVATRKAVAIPRRVMKFLMLKPGDAIEFVISKIYKRRTTNKN